ncbi:MAG: hypothetical protein ABI823_15935 [Bryobacteraceae bacterium]
MDRYLDMYDPQTPDEQSVVETLVDLEWRLLRIPALEARLFADDSSGNAADPYKTIRALDVLSRHEVRLRKLAKTTCENLLAMQEARRRLEGNSQPANRFRDAPTKSGFVLQNPQAAHSAATRLISELASGGHRHNPEPASTFDKTDALTETPRTTAA